MNILTYVIVETMYIKRNYPNYLLKSIKMVIYILTNVLA